MKAQNKNFYMTAKTMFGLEEILMQELLRRCAFVQCDRRNDWKRKT